MATKIGSDNPSSSSTCNKIVTVAQENSKNQIDQTRIEKPTSSDLVPLDDPRIFRTLFSLLNVITSPFKWKKKTTASDAERFSKLIDTDLNSICKASVRIANANYDSEIKKVSDELSKLKNEGASAEHFRKLLDTTKELKQQISIRPEDVPEVGVCFDAEGIYKLIDADLRSIYKASVRIANYNYDSEVQKVFDDLSELKKKGASAKQFRELIDKTKNLKKRISIMPEDEVYPHSSWNIVGSVFTLTQNNGNKQGEMKYKARYDELKEELQKCLLCFTVFPENAEIKKKVMIYWWIAVGLASETKVTHQQNCCKTSITTIEKTAEQVANEFFNELVEKGFIVPILKKNNLGVDTCKVPPSLHFMLSQIPKENKFFDFVEDESKKPDLKKFKVFFNLLEKNLDLKPEWFSTMKKVQVLYLGKWQNSNAHVIEVEYSRFMKMNGANVFKGLEKIKNLRFLSLQGISKFTNLPQTILKHKNLTILDLKGCPDLEVIPNGIGLLKNLTHLDMSECYLLDHMPKGLASLSKLQVLGGFVVVKDSKRGSMCTLDDLQKLKDLRKLSIHTGDNEFPKNADLRALNQFQALTKLTIAWGRGAAAEVTTAPKESHSIGCLPRFKSKKLEESNSESLLLPSELKKLTLQCFPGMTAPSWLNACHLKCLQKLYIRGGKLSNLCPEFDGKEALTNKWEVEVLQLKYLNNFSMERKQLLELFPKLNCLEMVDCPNSLPVQQEQ